MCGGVYFTPMDWSAIVRDLQARGMTLAKIGEIVGLSQSAIGDLATGYHKAPRGEAAIKLDRLYRSRRGKRTKATK